MVINRCYVMTAVMLFGIIGCTGVVQRPQIVELKVTDSEAEIIEKASSVRPSKRQMIHHQDEFIAFIHFGINTFTGVEW